MGLLSNAFSAVKNSFVGKALDFATVAFDSPVATVKAVIQGGGALEKLEQESFSRPLTSQIINTVVSGGEYAATTLLAGGAVSAIAEKGVLGAAASLIPKTVVGKVAGAIAVPYVTGAIISQPSKALNLALETPIHIAIGGGDTADLIANPTKEGAIQFLKDHPYLTAATAAVALAAAGYGSLGLASIISNYFNTKAVKENTEATLGGQGGLPTTLPDNSNNQGSPLSSDVPITPSTTTVNPSKTAGTKRNKSKPKAKPMGNISQRVNVIVSNKNSSVGIRATKRYLNREVLMN
jgi:hypothetical protein